MSEKSNTELTADMIFASHYAKDESFQQGKNEHDFDKEDQNIGLNPYFSEKGTIQSKSKTD